MAAPRRSAPKIHCLHHFKLVTSSEAMTARWRWSIFRRFRFNAALADCVCASFVPHFAWHFHRPFDVPIVILGCGGDRVPIWARTRGLCRCSSPIYRPRHALHAKWNYRRAQPTRLLQRMRMSAAWKMRTRSTSKLVCARGHRPPKMQIYAIEHFADFSFEFRTSLIKRNNHMVERRSTCSRAPTGFASFRSHFASLGLGSKC